MRFHASTQERTPHAAPARGTSAGHAGGGPRLAVAAPGGAHEREADGIARSVAEPAAPGSRLGCPCGGGCPRCRVAGAPVQATPVAADGGRMQAPPVVHEVLGAPGHPLDAATRSRMESRLGHRFGHVRVHTDGRAAESARAVGALAYTVGADVVFGAGRYAPDTAAGGRLLAHELVHVLQQRDAVQVQRATPEGETSTAEPAPAPAAEAAPAAASPPPPPGLRLADVWYDADGKPTEKALTEDDKTRLRALLDRLKKDDPPFYAAIENENVVVTRGALPEGNLGKHVLDTAQHTRTLSKLRWLIVEHGGIDPQGDIDMSSDAWKKGVERVQEAYPDSQTLDALAKEQETRTSATFSGALILDLDQIAAHEEVYRRESEKTRSTTDFSTPEPAQSAYSTLRHEAGHLLFERIIGFDKQGNPLPATPLPDDLKSKVKQYSGDEDITTDVELLSEYAAEGVEQVNGPFDAAKFAEENDPRFGVSGYHDVDGNSQAPEGFGVRMAQGLTLLAAKQAARDILAEAPGPVYLRTVPKPSTEQRLFEVRILTGPDKKQVRDAFEQLRADHPALDRFKASVVPY